MPTTSTHTSTAVDLNHLLQRWRDSIHKLNEHARAIELIAAGDKTRANLQAARDRQQLYRAARVKAQAIEREIRRTYTQITGDVAE